MTTRSEIIEVMARGMQDHSYPKGCTGHLAVMIRQSAQATLQALETVGLVDFSDKELGSSGGRLDAALRATDGPHSAGGEG